ncbi:hypothetical protein OE88DRAFT_1669429 [Heliocybe sulcata]|uniref:Uncharacterized protein n=1 Tax=Heliocybe sulcata TaxID=5364 RepID=A0A5C3MIZ6_9AGAM|nr:hypothetical protein OE88DRAFT_1669429 [Heliocybe sulcata]
MPNISSLLSGANDWFVSGPPSKLVHLMLEAARHSVEYIKGHKEIFITATAAAVVIPVLCYALPKLLVGVIQVLGFGSTGVVAGSLASLYQSVVLGGYTTAGSVFASLQSIGALGVFPPAIPVLVVLVLAGCVVAWLWPR